MIRDINKFIAWIYFIPGGQIISTRCTQRYDIKSRAVSLFGYPLYYESNNPRTVIQGNPMQPGVCWAFQDFPGYLLIQLRSLIYVTGFTLEHVSILILPNENMSSAPRKFNVWVCRIGLTFVYRVIYVEIKRNNKKNGTNIFCTNPCLFGIILN